MFTIKWRLTEWCNYRCSYCLRKFKGQDTKLNELNILKIAPQVNRLIDEAGKDVKLNLIGGEITYLNLIKIISLLKSSNLKKIHITTNFSNKLLYYVDLANYLLSRNIMLSMNVSYHNEYADLDEFIKKAVAFRTIALNLYSFKLEFVVAPENEKMLQEVKEKCKENNLDYLIELDKTQTKEYFETLLPTLILKRYCKELLSFPIEGINEKNINLGFEFDNKKIFNYNEIKKEKKQLVFFHMKKSDYEKDFSLKSIKDSSHSTGSCPGQIEEILRILYDKKL